MSPGLAQIGWATTELQFISQDGIGVGDDENSFAFDGCRARLWHNGESTPYENKFVWKAGDVIGCYLDMTQGVIMFFLNGVIVDPIFYIETSRIEEFRQVGGLYPALSILTHQQAILNFGHCEFAFKQQAVDTIRTIYSQSSLTWLEVYSMNDYGVIPRQVLEYVPPAYKAHQVPKSLKASSSNLMDTKVMCNICCELVISISLRPCGHQDICFNCARRLTNCPICRTRIESIDQTAKKSEMKRSRSITLMELANITDSLQYNQTPGSQI
jgi:hypothetical protein